MDICLTPPPPPPWSPPLPSPTILPAVVEQKSTVRSLKFAIEPLPPGTEQFQQPPPPSVLTTPQHPPLPKEPPPPPPPPANLSPTSHTPPADSISTSAAVISPQAITVSSSDRPAEQPSTAVAENACAANDTLGAALDSFYSDLAALDEAVPEPAISYPVLQKPVTPPPPQISVTSTKQEKKRKPKIKGSSSLKNRSVSSLVEKWKRVQETFDKD